MNEINYNNKLVCKWRGGRKIKQSTITGDVTIRGGVVNYEIGFPMYNTVTIHIANIKKFNRSFYENMKNDDDISMKLIFNKPHYIHWKGTIEKITFYHPDELGLHQLDIILRYKIL